VAGQAGETVTTTLLAHAIEYAKLGLQVFPLKPDKTPYTTHGMKDATDDVLQITEWWTQWPDALIGCRVPEDVVILDVDPKSKGDTTWRKLKAEHGEHQTTRTHLSGRGDGGGHLWFKRPKGKLSIKPLDAWAEANGTGHQAGKGKRWTSGVDLLHHNHRYTILPPSLHAASGKPYTWKSGHGVDVEPAPMPAWLADLITVDSSAESAEGTAVSETTGPNVQATCRNLRQVSPLDAYLDPDSIADWYSQQASWSDLLVKHDWTLVSGDGDKDGSKWRHPEATAAWSATIKHHQLFVYSPNTEFEVTEDGDPKGYTLFRAFALLEHDGDMTAAAKAARVVRDGKPVSSATDSDVEEADKRAAHRSLVEWSTFWTKERVEQDWMVEPLVVRKRAHALFAPAKEGKSLVAIEMAAAKASGNAVYRQDRTDPAHVAYLDYEMTEDDVFERLTDMGYDESYRDVFTEYFHYWLHPTLPPLDTKEGGLEIVEFCRDYSVDLLIIDTTGRAVEGPEDKADTFRAFHKHTGMLLKAAGITWLRSDHSGKDPGRGQRGSSSKNDDVDIVWQLSKTDDGFKLTSTHKRLAWIGDNVILKRQDGLLHHEVVQHAWAPGTSELAKVLDDLGAPLDINHRAARALLKEREMPARNATLADALRWRRRSTVAPTFAAQILGNVA
jgi:hypothetical protein